MKKIFLALAFVLAFSASAFASDEIVPETTIEQEEAIVVTNPFVKNWEMNISYGGQAYVGEYFKQAKFLDLWNHPSLDFHIQKWASPSFGIGIAFNASKVKALYMRNSDIYATFRDAQDPAYGTTNLNMMTGWTGNLFIKGSANLTNLFCGYRPDRVFEVLAYLGGGVIFPMHTQNYFAITGSFNAGLTARWNLCKNLAIDLNARGALVGDCLNGISYLSTGLSNNFPMDGNLGAALGLTWKFGYQKKAGQKVPWVSLASAAATSSTLAAAVKSAEDAANAKAKADAEKYSAEIAAANSTVSAKQAEIEDLKLQLANKKAKEAVIWQFSNFKIGHSTLTKREKVGLKACAEIIRQQPNSVFLITGYADNITGSPKYNQTLSRKRAETVYYLLVSEFGVDSKQLTIDSKGGVNNMFYNDPQCSRSVIISTVEK